MKRRNFIVFGALLNMASIEDCTDPLPDKTIRHLGEATRFGEPFTGKKT